MQLSRVERHAYLEGYGFGAAVVQGHVALGLPGVGVSIAQGLALELVQGPGEVDGLAFAKAQGLADAALAGEGR